MILDEIFPTPTWGFSLNEDLEKISNWILSQHQIDSRGKQASNYGGWQSKDFYVYQNTPLEPLMNFINSQIPSLCKTMGYSLKGRKIANFWINVNPKYSYNLVHTHPGAKFSGVFYVNVNEHSGNFSFINPMQYQAASEVSTKYTCSQIQMYPKNNDLLIFPGWIQHQVSANTSDEFRVSISFNIV